ncbi:MAG: CopD family protein [Candidatus Rokubacteria bacterium]|nr:CopD family protein [Candidatus Rokubacteria bacterium]
MIALGIAVRWAHLAACILLVGATAILLEAGRAPRETVRRWEARTLGWSRLLVLVALVSGLLALAHQTAFVEGRAAAAVDARALARVLGETQGGLVWLARHGLLLLLGAFLVVRANVERRADWAALRGEAALLGAAALGLLGAAGHSAAVEPGTAAAVANDIVHLVAAGLWVGGLVPLAWLLQAAAREDGADARPYAVLAARRFSRWALASVIVLGLSGALNALTHVGTVAGLVGTAYGRLLLAKLGLLVPILALAAWNRTRLVPALSGDGPTVGRPAMRMLARFVATEGLLALLLLGLVAAMGVTPPARHEQPTWPFGFRLSNAAIAGVPGQTWPVLVGSQVALFGVVGILCALVLRARRTWLLVVGLGLAGVGGAVALPPLAIDAYPTTYHRPPVPYHASSIAGGGALFRQHCARCHGPRGAGDGPDGRTLSRRPADLRAPHAAQHTAGDLFWWISHGISGGQMPAFAERLGEEERWDLVNFVRALGAAEASRAIGPAVEPDRPWLVAPDFAFAVGPTPPRALKDYRGRRIVLLVVYSLPGSRPRLAQLAQSYDVLAVLGVEVIAVPADDGRDAIARLGADPRLLFPVVTEGPADILETYRLFARAPHAEFLVDRQGYLRARWMAEGGTREPNLLLAEVQQLNQEKATVPAADEHVH